MSDSTQFDKPGELEEGVEVDGEFVLDKLEVIALGNLNDGDIVTKAGLARMFHRHESTVDRAVKRSELPLRPVCSGSRSGSCGSFAITSRTG